MDLFDRLRSVDDVDELRLEGSATDKETVNVRLSTQLTARRGRDRTTVEDLNTLSDLSIHKLGKHDTKLLVNILRVLGGSSKTSANSPDGLISDDNVLPVLGLDDLSKSLKLDSVNIHGFVSLALLLELADAVDDLEAVLEGELGLLGNQSVLLAEDVTALRVAENNPVGTVVLDHLRGDLTSESTGVLDVAVLSGDLDLGALGKRRGQAEVGRRNSNDDLNSGVELGLLKVVHKLGDELLGAVHLEVTTNEESASHFGISLFVDPQIRVAVPVVQRRYL